MSVGRGGSRDGALLTVWSQSGWKTRNRLQPLFGDAVPSAVLNPQRTTAVFCPFGGLLAIRTGRPGNI